MSEPASERDDLTTIGVTEEGSAVLDRLVRRGWFETDMAAFKASVAYALAMGIPPTESGRFQTKWNVGSLEKENFLEVVTMFYTGPRPWDYIRRLGDAALKVLDSRIDRADVPSDLFLDSRPA